MGALIAYGVLLLIVVAIVLFLSYQDVKHNG